MWSSWVVHNSDGTCHVDSGWLKNMGAIDFAGMLNFLLNNIIK